jgi:hypothetical protein
MTLQHQPPAPAQCADLIQHLTNQSLSPTALRVALNYAAAWMRTGRTTYQVSNARLAAQLGVGRSALTSALASLVNVGIIVRRPAANEGGVTRTELAATAAAAHRPGPAPNPAPRPTGTTDRTSGPQIQLEPGMPRVPRQVARPSVPRPDARAKASPQPPAKSDPKPVTLPPDQMVRRIKAITARLPAEVVRQYHEAVLACDQRCLPDMGLQDLSAEDAALLRQSVPVRQTGPRQANAAPPRPRGETIDPKLATQIASAAGTTGQGIADQIAFAITRGGLGRGDPQVGIRAALSLVRDRRWSRPRGWQPSWQGVVARSMAA